MNLWSKRSKLQPATPDENHYLNLYSDERAHHRDTAGELAVAKRMNRIANGEIVRLAKLVDSLTHSSLDADIAVGHALRDHERWHDCRKRDTAKSPAPSFPTPANVAPSTPQMQTPTAVFTPSAALAGDLL